MSVPPLIIKDGAIETTHSYHRVDTDGASKGELHTINGDHRPEDFFYLFNTSADRVITLTQSGNINLGGRKIVLADPKDFILIGFTTSHEYCLLWGTAIPDLKYKNLRKLKSSLQEFLKHPGR